MDSVANNFSPKSRMAKALVYTYSLLLRLDYGCCSCCSSDNDFTVQPEGIP